MKIFHHNDMDGYGSLYQIASAVLKDPNLFETNKNNFIKVNYESNVADKFAQAHDEDVYIVDYSFTPATLDQLAGLFDRLCKVVWIDHHESSIKLQESYPWIRGIPGIRDKSVSGAALCYMYTKYGNEPPKSIKYTKEGSSKFISILHPDYKHILYYAAPTWVKYVSDYDTWTHDFEESTYFDIGYNLYKDKLALFTKLDSDPMFINELIEKGKVIKSHIDSENSFYLKAYGYESSMYDGTKCLVVNKRSNSWIFGDKINAYPICVVETFNGIEWQYTLFSTDPSIDCSKYAEHYGGGGHRGAAGFRNPDLLFKKISE
jgi:uncharacterized protein